MASEIVPPGSVGASYSGRCVAVVAAGSAIVTVVPWPSSLAMAIVPPCASIRLLAMERPSPLPLVLCGERALAKSAR
jgi:hypothetical protein